LLNHIFSLQPVFINPPPRRQSVCPAVRS